MTSEVAPLSMTRRRSFSAAVRCLEISTRDLDEARGQINRIYGGLDIEPAPGSLTRFAWQAKWIHLGPISIIAGDIATRMSTRAAGQMTSYVFGAPRRGAFCMVHRGREQILTPGEIGFLADPDFEGHLLNPARASTFTVAIEPRALMSHLTTLTGAAISRPLRFSLYPDLRRGPGGDVLKVATLLAEAGARKDGPLGTPHVIAHLREALCSALLLGLDHSLSHLLDRAPPQTNRRAVKQVEEYLSAHVAEPIAISDLASVTGVGLRSLARSFKAAHGCSIRAFLTMMRLDLARQRLSTAQPGTTVMEVLSTSGFGHPGEFSLAYGRRFGERPSETLRRALRSMKH